MQRSRRRKIWKELHKLATTRRVRVKAVGQREPNPLVKVEDYSDASRKAFSSNWISRLDSVESSSKRD